MKRPGREVRVRELTAKGARYCTTHARSVVTSPLPLAAESERAHERVEGASFIFFGLFGLSFGFSDCDITQSLG